MRKRKNEQDITTTTQGRSDTFDRPDLLEGLVAPTTSQSKLHLEFQKQFIIHARKGLPIKVVCDLMRVSQVSFCTWQNQAAEGVEPYKTFIGRVHEARACDAAEIYEKTKVWAEKKKDPKYGLKILSQIHSVTDEKTIKKQVEVTGGVQLAQAYDVDKLSDSEFSLFCELVEKMTASRKVENIENTEPILIPEFSVEEVPFERS